MDARLVLGVVGAVVAVWLGFLVLFWVLRPKGLTAGEMLRVVPDVLRLLRSLIRDATLPLDVRLVVVGLLAWIISPIDLIPEFIPVLGPLDDIVVSIAALRYVRRRVGVDELRNRWAGSPEGFAVLVRVIGAS